MEAISNAELVLSANRASLGKTPQEGKSPSTHSHEKLGNHREGAKEKRRSCGPKSNIILEASLGGKRI